MGELELGNKLASITAYDNYFDKVVTQNYEIVAQEILRQHQERMFTFHKVGRWWDKNDEIDIVALNETTNEIMFGEVKWSNKKVGTDVFEELKGKSKRLEWGGNQRKEYFCLFSRNGFTPQMVNLAKTESVFLFEKDKEVS